MSKKETRKINLGFGNGALIEDGEYFEYIKPLSFSSYCRIYIPDITGMFTRRANRSDKKRLDSPAAKDVLSLQGNGTTLVELGLGPGVANRIETFIRNSPSFKEAPSHQPVLNPYREAESSSSLSEELNKLASLRDSGALTEDEFREAKRRFFREN